MNPTSFSPQPYSVVIATLGGPTLGRTINWINRGTVAPAEILICIPTAEATRASALAVGNVRIVETSVRGQVAQRATGFAQASSPLVLQMDDDMLPDGDCVERLMRSLHAKGEKAAVAPLLTNVENGESVYRKPARRGWVNDIYYWLLNGRSGYRPGRIDRAGTPVGVDADSATGEVLEVEWLPGGCVLHHRHNLVLDHFFPYPGKAYCEDLIHSEHLRQRGVRLFVDTGARCALEVQYISDAGWRDFLRGLRGDLKARQYFMALSGRRSMRLWWFYAVTLASYAAKRLRAVVPRDASERFR